MKIFPRSLWFHGRQSHGEPSRDDGRRAHAETDAGRPPWWGAFSLSLAAHLLLILSFLAASNTARIGAPKPPPDAIIVQLLGETFRPRAPAPSEPPAAAPAPPQPEAKAPSEPPASPAPAEAAAPADAVPLGLDAESKPPESARRQKPPPVKPPAAAAAKPPPRREARAAPQTPAPPRNVYEMLNRTLGRDTIAETLGTPEGRPNPDIQRYLQRIIARIQANWASPRSDISPRLVAGYAFTVEASGRISNVRLLQASGDPAFDRSVERALRQASPLPPLHPAFGVRHTFTVGFNPERLGSQ